MMRTTVTLVLLVSSTVTWAASPPASDRGTAAKRGENPQPAATWDSVLVVGALPEPRVDALAMVQLAIPPDELDAVRIMEITGDQPRPTPAQVERSGPPRLWWVVRGELPAGAKRTYRLEKGVAERKPHVRVERGADVIRVHIGESSVLQYNAAHIEPPEGVDARYGRSAFLHPLRTFSGAVVTDQFPPDHLHQSGVFLAHTKTEFQGRTPNFWDLLGGTGRVRYKDANHTASGAIFGEFRVQHEHVDLSAPGETVALDETWDVRVWDIGGRDAGYWLCDVTSTLKCATPSRVKLLEYHYGGFALRGARSWDAQHGRFLTSEGFDRLTGNHTRPRWCDLAGPVEGRLAGITLFTHPTNFRSPEPLRIHPTMPYMVYSPSYLGDWEITPEAAHVSRYRLVIHDGALSATTADRLWENFAEPLRPSVLAHP